MENAAKACIVVGALLTGVGGIMGALFMTSGDFVIARISCIASSDNRAVCPSNGFVQSGGSDCQIGNLGLFESAFTPDCADDTDYEISELVVPFEGDPLEFGPLFPAQNDLAGIVSEILGDTPAPAFEGCDAYFADAGPMAAFFVGSQAAAILGQTPTLDDTIREFYGIAVDGIYNGTDDFMSGLGFVFTAAAYGALESQGCVVSPSADDLEATTLTLSTIVQFNETAAAGFCNNYGGAGTLVPVELGDMIADNQFAGFQPLLGIVQTLIDDSVINPLAPVAAVVGQPLTVGSVNGGPLLDILPDEGMWAEFGEVNSTLCALFTSTNFTANPICSYMTVLEGVITDVLVAGGVPAVSDDLLSLLDFWQTAEENLLPQLGLEDRAELSAAVAAGNNLAAVATAREALQAATTAFVQEGDSLPQEVDSNGNPIVGNPITDYSAPLADNANPGTQAIALLCGVIGLNATTCSYRDLLAGAVGSGLIEDLATLGFVSLIVSFLDGCTVFPTSVSFAACIGATTAASPTATYVELDGLSLADVFANSVLSTLYSGAEILPTDTLTDQFAKVIPECKDDELDAEAIENAQGLAPAGTAFMLIGTLGGLATIAKQSKLMGIVAGIIGLLGGILFLAALLGVQQAPVFDAVGDDGPIEDNAFVYSLGDAATIATGTIALGIAGPIILVAGSVLLPKPDAGADIMSGGKY